MLPPSATLGVALKLTVATSGTGVTATATVAVSLTPPELTV
jgi:hypothetical protein